MTVKGSVATAVNCYSSATLNLNQYGKLCVLSFGLFISFSGSSWNTDKQIIKLPHKAKGFYRGICWNQAGAYHYLTFLDNGSDSVRLVTKGFACTDKDWIWGQLVYLCE